MRRSIHLLMTAAASAAATAVMAQPVPAALQACVHITQDSERLACFDREMAAASQKAAAHPGAASTAGASPPATAAVAASKPIQAAAGNGAALTGAGAVGAAAGSAAASAATASPPAASTAAGTAAAGRAVAPLTPEDKLGLSADGIHRLEVERGITKADVKPSKELTAHIAGVSRNAAGRAVLTLDNGQVWRQSETRSSFEARAGEAVKITPGVMGSFWLATNDHNRTRVERLP